MHLPRCMTSTNTSDKVYLHFVLSSLGCERALPGLSRKIVLFIFAIPWIGTRSRIPKLSVFSLEVVMAFETGALVMCFHSFLTASRARGRSRD
jgi:hypothetical protein